MTQLLGHANKTPVTSLRTFILGVTHPRIQLQVCLTSVGGGSVIDTAKAANLYVVTLQYSINSSRIVASRSTKMLTCLTSSMHLSGKASLLNSR